MSAPTATREAGRLVEAHACSMSTCAAPAGSPCLTGKGKVAIQYHTARFRLVPQLAKTLNVPTPPVRKPGSVWVELPRPWGDGSHKADNRDALPANDIVFQNYMPDLYLYIGDRMTDSLARPSNSRIKPGDWRNFSNLPAGNGHAYGKCDVVERGSGGNPWGVDPPVPYIGDGPGERRGGVVHCDDPFTGFVDHIAP
ncbi:hypothetical protein ACFY5C_27355 [Streptomyces sp. NPDC012935]|uniref:zinc finger domain-containing protein n=1 Tax=Streptomyces sp. NPDC012935 TaxID=3364857 RepID=UPI00368EF7EB